MNTFGKVVKHLRKLAGMTLEQVAAKVGSHKGYLSGIEAEKVNPPSAKVCKKFARIFERTLLNSGTVAHEEDWIELAWACKAPLAVRPRVLGRLENENPLMKVNVSKLEGLTEFRSLPSVGAEA